MTIETARNFFLWSAVVNYGVLLLWFFAFSVAHDWVFRLHGRWFRISLEQFDATHYSGMAIYKIGILLFAFVPYLALLIVS